jgi:3-hydroxyisobutyrate dehydrogenase
MSAQGIPVAFLGIGLMGGPMTLRLLDAGHDVAVWNRSPEKLAPVLAKGARAAGSPAEAARGAAVVFTCLTDAAAVEAVVFGACGVVEAGTSDGVLVDFSTIPPAAARAMAERLGKATGMRWIDAPVTGGRIGAVEGKLVVMAGGEADDIARVGPLIAAMASRFVHVGPQGAGLVAKLCNQVVNACNKVVLSEMLALAAAGGIDGGRLPEIMKDGSADSRQLQREVPRMAARDFHPPHGTAQTILKDLDIIAEFTRQTGTAMPLTALVNALYRLHVARGDGGLDSVSIFKLFDVLPDAR